MNKETEMLVDYICGQRSLDDFPDHDKPLVEAIGIVVAEILSEPLFPDEKR